MSQGHAEVKAREGSGFSVGGEGVKNWTQDHILKIRLIRPLDGLEGGVRKKN